MSDLVFERGRDIDGGIGDDQDLMVGRHIHDEDVTDAPSGAQSRLARHDRAEQFVSVQAAFHQQLGLALPDEFHGLRGRIVAVRGIDDFAYCRGRLPR